MKTKAKNYSDWGRILPFNYTRPSTLKLDSHLPNKLFSFTSIKTL